jgi:hypothetical protein
MRIAAPEDIAALELLAVELELATAVRFQTAGSACAPRKCHRRQSTLPALDFSRVVLSGR